MASGYSSAVSSVLHSGHHHTHYAETKSGSFIYHGDAASYHEWEFRTKLAIMNETGDQYATAISKVVDGLRGDAFVIAQTVGLDAFKQLPITRTEGSIDGESAPSGFGLVSPKEIPPTGIDLLIETMKKSVFPITTYEAKELFRQ